MKILNGSIILAATFMLLAVTSTCIAEGLIAESMREKGSGSEVSPENNIIKQQDFDFARSQYIQHSRKVVMPAGMPTSSHKDLKL